ncbi:MAG: glycosyltransferase [Planctomycetes bacterium]|nr:glycosyltransferase [Planctomycetota bacterium]
MRFCYLCNGRLDKQDAIKIHTLEVVQNLRALGHDVTLITPRALVHDLDGIPVIFTPSTRNRLASTLYNAAMLYFLPRYTAQARPHLFYVRQFNKCATPLLLARLFRKRLVLEVNGLIETETEVCGRRLGRVDAGLIELAYREAARIIAVTPQIRDHLVARYGVPPDRVRVVPNGVNTDQFRPIPSAEARRGLGLDPDVPTIGFIGNFATWQGIDLFLRAAPIIAREAARPPLFLVVGSGEQEDEYRRLAAGLGVADRVRFTGQVPVRESVSWINAFDVAVALKRPLPSGYSPLKLYSYLACARPVVATRTHGFETLEEHEAGLLVDPFDAREVADACLRLLADPALRRRMGENGRRYVLDTCSWRHVAEETARICAEAAAGDALPTRRVLPDSTTARPPAPQEAAPWPPRLRLLLVIDSLDVGGAEKQFIELVRRLDRGRYDVRVCLTVARGRLFQHLHGACDEIHVFQKRHRLDASSFFSLLRLLRSRPVDVVHSFLYYSNNLCKLAAGVAGVPVTIVSQRGSYDRTISRAKQFFDRWTNRLADFVTTNAESIRAYQIRTQGVDADRIEAIANGLDTSDYPLSSTDGYPERMATEGRFVLAAVGRLDPFKGYDDLFEALSIVRRRFPGVSLAIAGEGPLRDELEADCVRRGLKGAVTFLGYHPDVPALLSSCYATVLPSLAEGMPNVLLEAMAVQRPVVATAVDGITELVVPGETGLLVPPRDPGALARALEDLVASPERAREMGRAGRRRLEARFRIEETVRRFDALYQRLHARNGRRRCASST